MVLSVSSKVSCVGRLVSRVAVSGGGMKPLRSAAQWEVLRSIEGAALQRD